MYLINSIFIYEFLIIHLKSEYKDYARDLLNSNPLE